MGGATARMFWLTAFWITLMIPWAIAQASERTVTIDGEVWTITWHSDECESRAKAAVTRYWEVPVYRVERDVTPERYFVNDTTDCWIELHVQGVDDAAVVFKVTEDGTVTDEREFSYWGPTASDYPAGPYPTYPD